VEYRAGRSINHPPGRPAKAAHLFQMGTLGLLPRARAARLWAQRSLRRRVFVSEDFLAIKRGKTVWIIRKP
jgi:hypothetical protein